MTEPTTPDRPEESEKKRPSWLVWAVAGALLAGGLAAVFLLLGSDDNAEADGLDASLVLQLQTLCFESDPPLFYDDQGYCYAVDPISLSGDALIAARVLPNVAAPADADLTASGSGTPPAPAAPAPATPAAPAPATPPAPAAATPAAPTTAGAPAAPTTAGTTPTTTAVTAPTTTTEAPLPPINVGQTGGTGWTWRLTVGQLNGVACVPDGEGKWPPGCQDQLTGPYTVNFSITDGSVSGSVTVAQLGSKTVTFSGSVSPTGAASLHADMENLGNMNLSGALSDNCSITGSYSYSNGRDITGTFSLTRQNC